MAENSYFFNSSYSDKRTYRAEDFARYFESVLSSGIMPNFDGIRGATDGEYGLNVTNYIGSLRVGVKAGHAIIKGHRYELSGEERLTLRPTTGATVNRIDRIVLRLDRRASARYIKLFIVEGQEAYSPQPPALMRNANVHEISLAQVHIMGGQSYIDKIVDERLDESVCGIANSLINVPTSAFQQQFNAWFDVYKYENEGAAEAWLLEFKEQAEKDADAFAAWLNSKQTATSNAIDAWQAQEQRDFDVWFADLQQRYDGAVAGNIELEVIEARGGTKTLSGNIDRKSTKDLIYKKKVVHELPFRFPDYDAALAIDGNTYMFPQGLATDEVTGEIFIAYWNTGTIGNWIVVYDKNSTYKRCFRINSSQTSAQGEGLILKYENGKRYLYSKVTGTSLSKFDITELPQNLSINMSTFDLDLGVRQHVAYQDGRWFVQQGGLASEYNKGLIYYIYDDDFNKIGSMVLDNSIGGYRSGALMPLGVKTQGLAATAKNLVQLEGGYTTKDQDITATNYQGIKIISFDGRLLQDGVIEPKKMMEILTQHGYDVDFIEHEAICCVNESIYSLCLVLDINNPQATKKGLLIFEEMSDSQNTLDFSAGKKEYLKINKTQLDAEGLFPVGRDRLMLNPLNGDVLDNLDKILEFTNAASLRRFAFHTAYTTVTGFNGESLEVNSLYELFAIDTARYFLTVKRHTGMLKMWSITGLSGSRTLTELKDQDVQNYKLTQNNGTVIYPSGYTRLRDLPFGFYYLTGGNAANFTDLPIINASAYVEVIKAEGDNRLIRFVATSNRNVAYEQIVSNGSAQPWQIIGKIAYGTGNPEGSISSVTGAFYADKNDNNALYYKTTDLGNTGWKKVTLA